MGKIELKNFKRWDKLHTNGMSLIDISKKENVKYTTLYYGLKRNGFSINKSLTDKRRHVTSDTYFNNIDSGEKAYVYGLLLADGCLNFSKATPRITLKLKESDSLIVEKIRDILCPSKKLYKETNYLKNKAFNSVKIEIVSSLLASALEKQGFTANKTGNTVFPYFKNYLSHFVRGYFDGNGSISTKKLGESPCCYLCSADKQFLIKVKTLLDNKNINCSIYTELRKGFDMFKLSIKTDSLEKFFNYIYKDSTIHLIRKYDKYANIVVTRGIKNQLEP